MIFVVFAVVFFILFYNGCMILGKFGGKQAAVMNIVSGLAIGGIGVWIGFEDNLGAVGPTQSFVAASTCLAFAITYFIIAGEIFAGTDFKSLGWYCLSVAILMFLFGLGFANVLGTTLALIGQFAVLWIWWSVLFFVFFLVWALGKSGLAKFAGYFTIATAFITILYPTIAFFNYGVIGW